MYEQGAVLLVTSNDPEVATVAIRLGGIGVEAEPVIVEVPAEGEPTVVSVSSCGCRQASGLAGVWPLLLSIAAVRRQRSQRNLTR